MELQRQANTRNGRADSARHARLILLLAEGRTWAEIRLKLDCDDGFIGRWSKRFEPIGWPDCFRATLARSASTVSRGSRRASWTGRPSASLPTGRRIGVPASWPRMGGDISHMTVTRVWAKHGLKPHRLDHYMASNDPDFERKAADIIGLYLNPPQHAAVFCVDEKTAIQALDRKDPVLPLSPGRAERHGFEYYRHGTLSLYAAFNTKTGEVLGKTAARHTSAEFVAFLADIVVNQPRGKEIHVIVDNLSAHKTTRRRLPGGTPTSTCTSLRLTRPGSTRSSCGSPGSSVTSSHEASSPPSPTCAESSCGTSASTTKLPKP